MKGFEEAKKEIFTNPEALHGYPLEILEAMYRAGWKARGEVDAEIAEKLSDKFREADQHKWPEMTEDRTQGAEAVEWAIRNQE